MAGALAKATALHVAVERVLRHLAMHGHGLPREEVLAAALVRVESPPEAGPERYLPGHGAPR